jgi:RNAse (barnase) inhibitor barstar
MSGNVYAHDAGVANDPFGSGDGNVFQRVVLMQSDFRKAAQARAVARDANAAAAAADTPAVPVADAQGAAEVPEPAASSPTEAAGAAPAAAAPAVPHLNLFKTVRPNIVQSIRAFRVVDLADEAAYLKQHFLYAYCAQAQTKGEVLESIANAFLFPRHFGKNYDALFDCLTDLIAKAGPQPGFVVVLEGLPAVAKFDKEARETLLDVFREAAEFWAERKVAFRVFYSFA